MNPKTIPELSKNPFEVQSQVSVLKAPTSPYSDRCTNVHTHPLQVSQRLELQTTNKGPVVVTQKGRVEQGYKSGMKIKETAHSPSIRLSSVHECCISRLHMG